MLALFMIQPDIEAFFFLNVFIYYYFLLKGSCSKNSLFCLIQSPIIYPFNMYTLSNKVKI